VGRLLALSLLLVACDPTYLDEGFHVTDDGVTLHPGALPATVTATAEAEPFAREAVRWWCEAVGADALVYVDGAADVSVDLGLVPASTDDLDSGGEPLGIARVDYAADGAVLGADVTISSDIAYDEDTAEQVARHEIGGHAVFGLADDPGPPVTVDLRSIMSSPLDPLGTLTAHDLALLAPYLEGL